MVKNMENISLHFLHGMKTALAAVLAFAVTEVAAP